MSRPYEALSHQFTHTQQIVIETVNVIALEYDCTLDVSEAWDDYVLSVMCDGEKKVIGTVSAVKSMTIRGLLGFFEQAVLSKRCRQGLLHDDPCLPGD